MHKSIPSVIRTVTLFATISFLAACDNNRAECTDEEDRQVGTIISPECENPQTDPEGDEGPSTEPEPAPEDLPPELPDPEPGPETDPTPTPEQDPEPESEPEPEPEVEPEPEPEPIPDVTATFEASAYSITKGDPVTLQWVTEHADTVSISPLLGQVDKSGSHVIHPEQTTTYTLQAHRQGDEESLLRTVEIQVKPKASIEIVPSVTSGEPPLRVYFKPKASTDSAIQNYQWDFGNNYKTTDTVGKTVNAYYRNAGTYTVTLTATDTNGNVFGDTQEIQILSDHPSLQVTLNPETGNAPLKATATAIVEDGDGIDTVEWDFDGDGVFEISKEQNATTNANTSAGHEYTQAGTYPIAVRATDILGNVTTVIKPDLQVRAAEEGKITVQLRQRGAATGEAPFNAGFYTQIKNADLAEVQWSWDFDADGTVDSTEEHEAWHVYEDPGVYYPTVTVTDQEGNFAQDNIEVVVSPSLKVAITEPTNRTISPENEDIAVIRFTQNLEANTKLIIEDRDNNEIAILQDWQDTNKGELEYVWDGKDANGSLLPSGDYYAVLFHGGADNPQRVDERQGWDYPQGYVTRERINSRFAPFKNDPLELRIRPTVPHEVTTFIGYLRVNVRVRTFDSRRVVPGVHYSHYWLGDDDQGRLLQGDATRGLLPGMFSWRLPSNTIYVLTDPQVSNMNLSPAVVSPLSVGDGHDHFSVISYTLSKDSDIEVLVSDADSGTEVFHKLLKNVEAGDNEYTWNARNDAGHRVSAGRYFVKIRALDALGNKTPFIGAGQRVEY